MLERFPRVGVALTAGLVFLQLVFLQLAVAQARAPIRVEVRGSRVVGSATLRIENAIEKPCFSSQAARAGSASWVSFRPSHLSVRVPRGLAARISAAARSGDLRVTTAVGDYGHGLLRLTAGTGSARVVLQRTRFSIGSEALQVQLGEGTEPFWIARASVKESTGQGKVHGASGVSRSGDVSLLDPLTLQTDTRAARVGELSWFSKPATRATLLRPFPTAEPWSKASLPATLITRSGAPGPARQQQAAPAADRPSVRAKTDRGSSGPDAGKMTPESFDPVALLASKGIDAAQLRFVPSLGPVATGLGIYYRGKSIGYYSRDATHRSMNLAEKLHGKGIGTIAYLVMAKLLHDSRRGLLDSDLSSESESGGNLSPQAQSVWRRFVDSGYAEAHRAGAHTVYQMKQSTIDSVSWSRFTPLLADRAP